MKPCHEGFLDIINLKGSFWLAGFLPLVSRRINRVAPGAPPAPVPRAPSRVSASSSRGAQNGRHFLEYEHRFCAVLFMKPAKLPRRFI